ncbi:hypothetical protein KJ359_009338 [Pestalotiopsis sp. 9143b]|nr:hypothetical protein KJ359_009338 [Pestalotiopsis sp. 9143b]
MAHTAHHIHEQFEPRPDAQKLTGDANGDVDYEPHPEKSIKISTEHQQIMQKIINLYSGSASEDDMQATHRHIQVFSSLRTLKTEVVKDTPTEIVWKMQHEYTPKGLGGKSKAVNSLISVGLDDKGKVRYHKDMWNEKDYSHGGLGKFFKTLQADVTPAMSRPPKTL